MTCSRSSTSLAAWLTVTVRTRFLPLMCQHGLHKCYKQGTGLKWLGRELRVKLDTDKERMTLEFKGLNQTLPLINSSDAHAMFFEGCTVVIVELVTMTMAFGKSGCPIGLFHPAPRCDGVLVDAKPHGPAQLLHTLLRRHEVDHKILGLWLELLGVRVRNAEHVPCKLDAGNLHAQADAQKGQIVGTCIPRSQDHAFDATFPETARNQNAVVLAHIQQARPL